MQWKKLSGLLAAGGKEAWLYIYVMKRVNTVD